MKKIKKVQKKDQKKGLGKTDHNIKKNQKDVVKDVPMEAKRKLKKLFNSFVIRWMTHLLLLCYLIATMSFFRTYPFDLG